MGDECNVTSGDHDMKNFNTEENLCIKDKKDNKEHIDVITKPPEPLIQYPIGDTYVDNEIKKFPYGSGLRAEAPPFTPDCTLVPMKNPTHMTSINKEYQEHCFINVNLMNEDLINIPDDEIMIPKTYPIPKKSIEDDDIKLLDDDSAQPINVIVPEVEVAINANEIPPESSPSTAIKEEVAPNQYPERSRMLLRRFTFGNSTKVAVLIASIVISLILIIYIFV